ncbi:hypothetical protein Tco_0771190 [Tanacetum coccineum]|uniref:Uncharacterized protein n=1 Tax=Tanacetum coccineum TaxID=301880 RepID=A0ABQ4ZEA8_9ASTR
MVGGNGGNQFRQYAGQNIGYQNGYNALQNVGNQVVQDAVQNQGVQNTCNHKGQIGVQNIGNGNVVAARLRTDQLRYTTMTPAIIIEIFNMFYSEAQTGGGTVDQHPATVEETRAYFESLYNNLAIEVEKVNVTNDLSNPVTSNSVPTPQESKNVIAPGMYRINPFKPSREEKYKDVNSDSNGLSSIGVNNTAKTIRQQPRSNTKNDRVPSASKSSCIKNKEVKVEEHHRNLLLSKNKKHMSSECYPNLFMVRRLGLLQAYDRESEAAHQLSCLEDFLEPFAWK